jgi:hypothetical protein
MLASDYVRTNLQGRMEKPPNTPRYAQIFNTLSGACRRASIRGHAAPPRTSCAEFNASRFTVREALRRWWRGCCTAPGPGGIVVSTTPQAQYVHSLSSLNDLFQFALDTHYDPVGEPGALAPEARARSRRDGRGALATGPEPAQRRKDGKAIYYVLSYIAPRVKIRHARTQEALRRPVLRASSRQPDRRGHP